MAELKLPRLLAAAKEFNVGQDTIIDFLIGKGFPKDELKPTSKLSEDMYRALQQEFQSDKAAKMKSDQVDLPKGAVTEAKKKKEEEEILFKKEEKAPAKAKKEVPAPVTEEPKVAAEEEMPEKGKTPKEEQPKEEEVIKLEAPELEGPKIVKKIDLSAIDSSTRPKKTAKAKKEEEVKPEAEEAPKKLKKTKKMVDEFLKSNYNRINKFI